MDYINILKRALDVSWNYRALWLFGALVALTAGGAANPGSSSVNWRTAAGDFPPGFSLSPEMVNTLISIGIAIVCLIFILAIAFTILRYISITALIQMVDQHEATGDKKTIRQGFRLGWSGSALRIFLIDLIFGVAAFIIFFGLFIIIFLPLLAWLTDITLARILGTVVTVGMFILFILLAIVYSIIYSLLVEFFYRASILEGLGVFAAVKRGFKLVVNRLLDVVVMGLILFGVGLIYGLLLVPVVFILLVAGVLLGGLPALLFFTIVNQFVQGAVPWIVAILIGLPILLVVVVIPSTILSGLWETYKSSAWTLTYREFLALEKTPVAAEVVEG
jgi:hypothetical protein